MQKQPKNTNIRLKTSSQVKSCRWAISFVIARCTTKLCKMDCAVRDLNAVKSNPLCVHLIKTISLINCCFAAHQNVLACLGVGHEVGLMASLHCGD